MFISLLVVTLFIALSVAVIVACLFNKPVSNILNRIIADEISSAWVKYLKFATIVVGISSGVRIYDLERYITPHAYDKDPEIIILTSERWILEVYRTIIETLQGIAWLLLVFFAVALIAYVIVRMSELKRTRNAD